MDGYLLDTNHLSPLVTLNHPLRERILSHYRQGYRFAIPLPALSEFLFGINLLPRAADNRAEWNKLKSSFNYYPLDHLDAQQAAILRLSLRKEGRQLALFDALIAVVALRYHLILLTTDKDFQPIPNLRLENWLK